MEPAEHPTPTAFLTEWIDLNVSPHPFPEDLPAAIAGLVERCIEDAASHGITVAEIEAQTGYHVAELILAAFLARWNPESGHGGFA
jgi:hypothetical protein